MPAVAVRKHARESATRGSLPGRLLRYVATLLSLYNICSRRLYWGWLMQMLNVWRCWCKQHSRLDRGLTGLTPFSMHRGAWIPAQRRHPHVPRTAPCSYPQFWYLEWLFFTGATKLHDDTCVATIWLYKRTSASVSVNFGANVWSYVSD
jgi:hypothetical protein